MRVSFGVAVMGHRRQRARYSRPVCEYADGVRRARSCQRASDGLLHTLDGSDMLSYLRAA